MTEDRIATGEDSTIARGIGTIHGTGMEKEAETARDHQDGLMETGNEEMKMKSAQRKRRKIKSQ